MTINNLIEKMTSKTVRWQRDLFSDFTEEKTETGEVVRKIAVTTENVPVYEVRVAGEKVGPWFLFDKLLRDFYQYTMNSFDSMSQIANSGLLANKSKSVDSADFQRMASCFQQATYKTAFPKTSAWFESVSASKNFEYIEAINNRTKHTADISNKLSMGILGSSNTARIGPLFRKGVPHDRKELSDQLQANIDFLQQSWMDFLAVFCEEYVLDVFVDNRIHEICGVYQQKMKEDPKQSLSYAYIQVVNDFNSMPDELYVLFVKVDEEVKAHECPFETLLICGTNEMDILGRYVAVEPIGDDCLLHYRKYKKDSVHVGMTCMFAEMKGENTNFYHWNPFFNITPVSDDDNFLKRSSLPF
ncbi:MAG: hypothetical protein AB7C97_09190 [Oscillospiraceae bacterium]